MSRFRPPRPATRRRVSSAGASDRRSPTGRVGRGASRWFNLGLRVPRVCSGSAPDKAANHGHSRTWNGGCQENEGRGIEGFPSLTPGAPNVMLRVGNGRSIPPDWETGMASKKFVHIIGTGTILGPRYGLVTDSKELDS